MIAKILITVIFSYLLGSFPSAYVLMKRKYGVDITQKGSGNVGSLNALRTGSKFIGISVFILDFLKGAFAVKIALFLFGDSFIIAGSSLLSVVSGHCFSVYIKFKGGRGLATALGGSLFFIPQIPFLWIVIWLIGFLYKKNVHFANASATFLLMLLIIFSGNIIAKYSLIKPNTLNYFIFFTVSMLLVILFKHIKPIKDFFLKERINGDNNE